MWSHRAHPKASMTTRHHLLHLDLTPGAPVGKGAGVSYPKVKCIVSAGILPGSVPVYRLRLRWIGWCMHEYEPNVHKLNALTQD